MRRLVLILILVLGLSAWVHADETAPPTRTVLGNGTAPLGDDPLAADEEAVWEAKRNAVEQAYGQVVRAREFGRDHAIEESEVWGSAEGFVQSWEIVPGSRHVEQLNGSPIVRLQIRAQVAPLTAIHHLTDLKDLYADLSRPRIRVVIEGDHGARAVQDTLISALRKEGFELAQDDRADVTLSGRLSLLPTMRLGDNRTPYGLGASVATCKAQLTARLISHNSEEVLDFVHAQGVGQSFQSDADAASRAAADAGSNLCTADHALFTHNLLLHWAQERIEGYVVCVQVHGLDTRRADMLREQLRALRGFRRFVEDTYHDDHLTLRFLTRSDTRSLRRHLPEMHLDGVALRVQDGEGALIVCTANRAPRAAGNSLSTRTAQRP